MKRLLRIGALCIVAIAAIVALSTRASAQAPTSNACCTFTVDVAGFPASCFRMVLTTRWSCGTLTHTIGGNGVFAFPIACAVPCPPPPGLFFWASLNGGATMAWFNFPATFKVNGCCAVVRIGKTAAGCIVVTIRPANPPC